MAAAAPFPLPVEPASEVLLKEYKQVAEKCKIAVDILLAEPDNFWKKKKTSRKAESKGAYVMRKEFKDNGNNAYYFRGKGFLPFDVDLVFKAVFDPKEMSIWDKDIAELHAVDLSPDGYYAVAYTKTKKVGGGLISSRDFVALVDIKKDTPKYNYAMYWSSVSHPSFPAREGSIRGLNHPGGYFLKADPVRKGTELTILYRMELGGKLPKRIVKKAMGGTVLKTYQKLHRFLTAKESGQLDALLAHNGDSENEDEDDDEDDSD